RLFFFTDNAPTSPTASYLWQLDPAGTTPTQVTDNTSSLNSPGGQGSVVALPRATGDLLVFTTNGGTRLQVADGSLNTVRQVHLAASGKTIIGFTVVNDVVYFVEGDTLYSVAGTALQKKIDGAGPADPTVFIRDFSATGGHGPQVDGLSRPVGVNGT